MALLPKYEDKVLTDGTYIHALPFCLQNYNSDLCRAHYESLCKAETGFFTCPYGLSTLVYAHDDKNMIFSCLHERGTYKKKQARITQSKYRVFNPILDADEILSLAENEYIYRKERDEFSKKMNEVNDLLHETRKLNGQIKTACDLIWESGNSGTDYSVDELLSIVRNIHIFSFIVYNRFQYFDTILNPTLSLGAPYNAIVFKKFDKMRKLLRGYNRKNVWISLETPSSYNYRIYQSFETLLFILLENGIKYSPNNKQINIFFEENNPDKLTVKIESIGPFCRNEDIEKLGTRGFRGYNAQLLDSTGQGIGLHFAKSICSQHGIEIDFSSSYSYKDRGVAYGPFTVKLEFDHKNQP